MPTTNRNALQGESAGGLVGKFIDWLFHSEDRWEQLRCRQCLRVMGEYKFEVMHPWYGHQGYVTVPGQVRCLECAGKDKVDNGS
jgi:hypothetical protein